MKKGMIRGLPLVMGYFPVAFTFGILCKNTGLSVIEAGMFSMIVFAGASQFMAINMIALGVGHFEIVIATFLMNLRHFLYSTVVAEKLEKEAKKYIPVLAFGVTDEVFSVAVMDGHEKIKKGYLFGLQLIAYSSWVSGTFAGYITGNVIPEIVSTSLGIALYALFAAILVPGIRKSIRFGFAAGLAAILNTILGKMALLSAGWNFILAVIITCFLFSLINGGEENE